MLPSGVKLKLDIRAPHFTVIFPAFASRHEAVTEIDEAPEGHKREENGLLQADAMSPVRLLLEKAGLADVGAQPQIGPGKEDRPFAVSPFELNHGADLAVVDGDRTFGSNLRPLSNHGCLPVDATSRIDLDPVTGDMVEVNLIAKVKGQRVRDIDSLGHELGNFLIAPGSEFHCLLHFAPASPPAAAARPETPRRSNRIPVRKVGGRSTIAAADPFSGLLCRFLSGTMACSCLSR